MWIKAFEYFNPVICFKLMLCYNPYKLYLQTTVQEESKNVKEDISERFDHLKVSLNVSFKLLIFYLDL